MILFISHSGECLPIAYRMQAEGESCAAYLHGPRYRRNYDGLVNKVSLGGLKQAVKQAVLVIFDITRPNRGTAEDKALLKLFGLKPSTSSVFGPVADVMKKDVSVIGCSAWSEDIELDRNLGVKVAGSLGLGIPRSQNFKTIREGVKFLQAHRETLWVLKPHGNQDLSLTYVEKHPGDLISLLNGQVRKKVGGEKFDYLLQEVVDGVEISTEGWFDGRDWTAFNHTIEDKKFMAGDLGMNIGSQNNVVWMKDKEGLLTREIKRLSPYLQEAGYVGPVDINCIVSREDHKPYFLEFSPRMGWDALYCLLTLLETPVSRFLKDGFQGRFASGYAGGMRISIPPYPYAFPQALRDMAQGVEIQNSHRVPWMWWEDVKLDDGRLVCAGADGIMGAVTGRGGTIKDAVRDTQEKTKRLKIGGSVQYRTDLGKRAIRAVRSLVSWGHQIW